MRSIFVIVAASIVVTSSLACEVPGGDAGQYRSPGGVYTVHFVGRRSAPTLPFVEYRLRAKIFRNSELLVNDWPIHYADWFDNAFDIQYSGASWLTDQILRVQSSIGPPRPPNVPDDVITIENNSGRRLRLLTIKSKDLFLIVDVPVGWKTQLSATPQTRRMADFSEIAVSGVWADTTTLAESWVIFDLPKGVQDAFRYTVDLQPAAVEIRETQHAAKPHSLP
jgi:hypothetical protein